MTILSHLVLPSLVLLVAILTGIRSIQLTPSVLGTSAEQAAEASAWEWEKGFWLLIGLTVVVGYFS